LVIKINWLFLEIDVYGHVLLQAALNGGCPSLDGFWGLEAARDVGGLALLALFVDGYGLVVRLDLLCLNSRTS